MSTQNQSQISRTELSASLLYKGYAFAWFYDSELAIKVANKLAKVGLLQQVNTYLDFDIDFLHGVMEWQYMELHGHGVFIQYHRSIKISEVHVIGKIISETLKENSYEKGNN